MFLEEIDQYIQFLLARLFPTNVLFYFSEPVTVVNQ